MAVEIRDLRQFTVLAEELHFTHAADRLHVSQSALSLNVKRLERGLGVDLFERSTRSVVLTAAGQLILARAYSVVQAFDEALAEAARLSRGAVGVVRVGTPHRLRPQLRMAAIRRLAKSSPNTTLEFTTDSNSRLIDAVLTGTLDAALCYGPIDQPQMESRVALVDTAVAVLPRNHPLAAKRELTFYDLEDESIIIWSNRAYSDGGHFDDWYRRTGAKRSIAQVSSEYDEYHSLVLQGLGVEVVPRMCSRPDEVPDVSVIPIAMEDVLRPILYLIHRKGRENHALEAAEEAILGYFV